MKKLTVGKIVDYFLEEYNHSLKKKCVFKPISYALYQTWKWADVHEQSRFEEDNYNEQI